MQQDTPPVLPTPSAPSAPPPAPQQQERTFYQPAAPAPYVGSLQDHVPASQAPVAAPAPDTVTWEASEYVHTDKGGLWLVSFIIVVLVAAAIALWFQAWTFVVLIVVMGVTMGIFAFRPPRTVSYTLNNNGIQIASRNYPYSDFRAFGILEDGAFFTMTLIPVKRFSPAISVYFAEAEGEQIVDMVGGHLPMQNIEPDFIDTIMRRLRF